MGGIGIVIIELFQDTPTLEILETGMAWYYQLPLGITYGLITAWLGWQLIKLQLMNEVKNFYSSIIRELNLNWIDVIFISFCAGVGEELLFRGGIQYWLGMYITSIIFVAIHGYLNPKDWKISLYGIYLTIVMIGISYAFEKLGLISAMAAHFAIDVYLLGVISLKNINPDSSLQ
ncbi:MAG: CPBP family intramembrane metalloprotease [Flavobacteriales bacterium]|nr:CPBP family intramembrane metalloprotease [Flavobacteriales bacterium]